MAKLTMLRPMVPTLDTAIAAPPPKTAAPIYGTPEHKAWRKAVIARAGGKCQGPGPHKGWMLYADHVVEIKDGGDPLDVANGQALCAACHTRKTASERAKRQAR